MTIHTYKGYQFLVRYYTHEELVKIDEDLPQTGASQEAGFYWDEIDIDNDPMGAPSGPYANEEEAIFEFKKIADRYKP